MKRTIFVLGVRAVVVSLVLLGLSASGHITAQVPRALADGPAGLVSGLPAGPQPPGGQKSPRVFPACGGSGTTINAAVGGQFSVPFGVAPLSVGIPVDSFSITGSFDQTLLQVVSIVPGNIPNITNFTPLFNNTLGTFSALGDVIPSTPATTTNDTLAIVTFKVLAPTTGTQIIVPNFTIVFSGTPAPCQATLNIVAIKRRVIFIGGYDLFENLALGNASNQQDNPRPFWLENANSLGKFLMQELSIPEDQFLFFSYSGLYQPSTPDFTHPVYLRKETCTGIGDFEARPFSSDSFIRTVEINLFKSILPFLNPNISFGNSYFTCIRSSA